jgi:prolyl-tRNA synthetase
VVLVKRVTSQGEARKEFLPEREGVEGMPGRLEAFQAGLLRTAKERRESNSYRDVHDLQGLREIMEGPGGFVYTGWSGDPEVEQRVKEETKATIRVIPDAEFRSAAPPRKCIGGGEARMEVVWAKAY